MDPASPTRRAARGAHRAMGFQDRGYSRHGSPPFAPDWTGVNIVIAINVAVWLANFVLCGDLVRELVSFQLSLNDLCCLRSDLPQRPWNAWQLLTYGFLHDGPSIDVPLQEFNPWHLLFNMLTLWFFGRELESLMGRAEFLRFYCAAIVLAGVAWVIGERFNGVGDARLVGASGGVMAVLAAFIWYYPRQTVLLYGLLPVPVWALGVLYLVYDLRGAWSNAGNVAHVAHLAGALFGMLYAWRGWSLEDVVDLPRRFWARPPRMRVVRPDDERRPADDDRALREEVDRILAKISRSGESSLSRAERDALTRASQRFRDRAR